MNVFPYLQVPSDLLQLSHFSALKLWNVTWACQKSSWSRWKLRFVCLKHVKRRSSYEKAFNKHFNLAQCPLRARQMWVMSPWQVSISGTREICKMFKPTRLFISVISVTAHDLTGDSQVNQISSSRNFTDWRLWSNVNGAFSTVGLLASRWWWMWWFKHFFNPLFFGRGRGGWEQKNGSSWTI